MHCTSLHSLLCSPGTGTDCLLLLQPACLNCFYAVCAFKQAASRAHPRPRTCLCFPHLDFNAAAAAGGRVHILTPQHPGTTTIAYHACVLRDSLSQEQHLLLRHDLPGNNCSICLCMKHYPEYPSRSRIPPALIATTWT